MRSMTRNKNGIMYSVTSLFFARTHVRLNVGTARIVLKPHLFLERKCLVLRVVPGCASTRIDSNRKDVKHLLMQSCLIRG